MRTFYLLIISALISSVNLAQSLFITTYPTQYDKDSREVLVTPDGGYLIAGSTNNSNVTDADLYVMKADQQGNFLWGKTYGGSKPEYAFSMLATSDGNYFVVGYSMSFGGGDMDIYVIKIDPSGNLIWQKTFGGNGNEHGREIISTSDGNYVIVGSSNSGQTSQQIYLMKMDLQGNSLWSKFYGGDGEDGGNSLKQTADGGYILAGHSASYGHSNGIVYMVRTNSTGDTLWTKFYDTGNLNSEAVSLVNNSDGSFAFVVRDSTASRDIDVRFMKTDGSGNIIWNKNYGGTDKDTPKRLRTTNDGGYVISSTSRSFGWINPDMWLLKTNSTGDTSWTRHYGGPNHEHGNDVKQTSDGGYVITGHSKSYGNDGQRIMLVRVNPAGTVGLRENQMDLSFNLFPNPVKDGQLNILNGSSIEGFVRIINSLGQTVYYKEIEMSQNETKQIALNSLVPGVYFVTVQTQNGAETKKIVLE